MSTNDLVPAHISVLYHEIINALAPKSSGCYIDGTVGAGGHAWGILEASSPNGQLLGFDLDPQALVLANQRLSVFQNRFQLIQASYTSMKKQIQKVGWDAVDGITLDLGLSSMQLDSKERGFSFRFTSPLDMRFGNNNLSTAADLLNNLSEVEISTILWEFGEERFSRRIARLIIAARPIETTTQLAQIVEKAYGNNRSHIHPATRTFQALRIAVNHELQSVQEVIPTAIEILKPGGRLAIISFHSLEDRIVKNIFRRESKDCICPPEQLICTCGHKAQIKELTKKPLEPSENEKETNQRARSAKLRIAEKLKMA
ncbi:MAG: 16S rRNA (cytosine(1402)-N(4))-methyltransferase [Chloroflexi bacterium HGW-Chloroflexi-8]|jgi:16S rRNA (cytosine1402-N4)-methyltransferase|nr:MAG: 16S rRNA (cytosine(1402)-N(4))-methyltransferase [Chloroflexi bacterium HGW-Chloroflexi-8]